MPKTKALKAIRKKYKILQPKLFYQKRKFKKVVNLKYVADEKLLKTVELRFGEQGRFFTEQIRLSKKPLHGRRYSKELKEFSLRQHFQSPLALGYRSLSKKFIVPCIE